MIMIRSKKRIMKENSPLSRSGRTLVQGFVVSALKILHNPLLLASLIPSNLIISWAPFRFFQNSQYYYELLISMFYQFPRPVTDLFFVRYHFTPSWKIHCVIWLNFYEMDFFSRKVNYSYGISLSASNDSQHWTDEFLIQVHIAEPRRFLDLPVGPYLEVHRWCLD